MREDWAGALADATREVWHLVAEVIPQGGYLAGGTALAVRLGHRQSRDLDVFVPRRFDTDAVERRLRATDTTLAVTSRNADTTLNAVFGGARVQFLSALGQRSIDQPEVVGGMPMAGLRDLLAMKLKVIGDRGELRDYVDLMSIEQHTPHRFEQGLGYYIQRYQVGAAHASIDHIVRALAAVDDLAPDPVLEHLRSDVVGHFVRRAPQVVRHLQSLDLSHGMDPSSG